LERVMDKPDYTPTEAIIVVIGTSVVVVIFVVVVLRMWL
jgi:uncharacterized membrane protein YidH (DUF202 family)